MLLKGLVLCGLKPCGDKCCINKFIHSINDSLSQRSCRKINPYIVREQGQTKTACVCYHSLCHPIPCLCLRECDCPLLIKLENAMLVHEPSFYKIRSRANLLFAPFQLLVREKEKGRKMIEKQHQLIARRLCLTSK